MIAANKVSHNSNTGETTGFNSEYNALDIYWKNGHVKFDHARKTELAQNLIKLIIERFNSNIN